MPSSPWCAKSLASGTLVGSMVRGPLSLGGSASTAEADSHSPPVKRRRTGTRRTSHMAGRGDSEDDPRRVPWSGPKPAAQFRESHAAADHKP